MKYAIAIAVAICLLTGCAAADGEHAPPIVEPSSNEREADSSATTHPNDENAPLPEEETPAQEDDVPLPPAEPAYRLNANFDIKPIDESAPANVVLLTFDDGPKDESMLLQMLDTLDRYDAKAIFFVNGYRVKSKPDLLKLIHERGQYIGNHSWDHINLKKESEEVIDKQLTDVQHAVAELIGVQPLFFRPPFGAGNDYVKAKSRELGMLYMTWSNGSLDWDSSNKNDPDGVIRTVMEQLRPGSNILMHELQWTADALDGLLSALQQEGYGFVDPGTIHTAPDSEQ